MGNVTKRETLLDTAYYPEITLSYITADVLRNLLGAGISSEFTVSGESAMPIDVRGEQCRREYEEEK